MDVVGSEIGQKMRSAIKAKLTELGCYVDDELPDYVMVMVANKRTRTQMEDDLQLFLGGNTELFVNWLHQVLKKLQEVTVVSPVLKVTERSKSKERSVSKDRKSKEKKHKQKKSDMKKSKKKDKEKLPHKEEKKTHKSKKKSKHHEMIRPNVPPLLMNMEKESEPSITDVFAGQILKNHGITLDPPREDPISEKKPVIAEIKRPILPIIDPASISSHLEPEGNDTQNATVLSDTKDDQLKEINQIEAKIQGLKQKLSEQLDSMSDDDDFINLRTEADELMNDFAEEVFQEVPQQSPVVATPPLELQKSIVPPPLPSISNPIEIPKETTKDLIESLPQIELKLPKRPLRERLGNREEPRLVTEAKEKEKTKSPERFTPDREPDVWNQKTVKSRSGGLADASKRISGSIDNSDKLPESSSKKLTSKVSTSDNRPSRSSCASVVRVRPRPRVSTPASSLLLRAVADAHKSLLNTPSTKTALDSQQVKRALVLPMRRCIDAKKIVIEVPTDNVHDTGDNISLGGDIDSEDDKSSKVTSDTDKEEYVPELLTKRIINNAYTPSRRNEVRTSSRKDDTLIIETINIHNTSANADKKTQFIVTMDGYHPNAFLAKKLKTEGILAEDDEINKTIKENPKPPEVKEPAPKEREPVKNPEEVLDKRLSSTSEESATEVVIKKEEVKVDQKKVVELKEESPVVRKRKASPIVFDVDKKVKETEHVRERTESTGSDNHVTIATVTNTHKYDAVPPLSVAERKPTWCRAFPACRYGSSCAFAHPRCKFLAACTRRNCVYSHSPNAPPLSGAPIQPSVASHVVPVASFKTISSAVPSMCKFYPNCVNPTCHFYHPKPCRYGNSCANKLECNFYHADVPAKWKYPV